MTLTTDGLSDRFQLRSNQQFVAIGLFVAGSAWIPSSALLLSVTWTHLLPLFVIGLGLYDLFNSGFLRVTRPAVIITLGVGLQLVAVGVVTPMELLVLWPLSVVTFGVLVLVSSYLDAKGYGVSSPL